MASRVGGKFAVFCRAWNKSLQNIAKQDPGRRVKQPRANCFLLVFIVEKLGIPRVTRRRTAVTQQNCAISNHIYLTLHHDKAWFIAGITSFWKSYFPDNVWRISDEYRELWLNSPSCRVSTFIKIPVPRMPWQYPSAKKKGDCLNRIRGTKLIIM